MKKLLVCITLCAVMFTMPAVADLIIIGNPPNSEDGNSFPWGFSYNAEYQQVYAASEFPGAVTITGLEFYNTQVDSGSTSLPTGTYTISFSTTSVGVGEMSGNFDSNKGIDDTVVFTGSIAQAWSFGMTLHIQLDTPFVYDPANGNLLMDVVGSDVNAGGGRTFFDVHWGDIKFFQRVFCPFGEACDFGVPDIANYGLVTGFNTSDNEVPEAGTLLMLGTGLIGSLGAIRRRLF